MVCVFLVSDLSFGEKPQNKHRNKGQLSPFFSCEPPKRSMEKWTNQSMKPDVEIFSKNYLKKIFMISIHPRSLTARPCKKWMVGRRSFAFGARPIFKGYVSFMEGNCKFEKHPKCGSNQLLPKNSDGDLWSEFGGKELRMEMEPKYLVEEVIGDPNHPLTFGEPGSLGIGT